METEMLRTGFGSFITNFSKLKIASPVVKMKFIQVWTGEIPIFSSFSKRLPHFEIFECPIVQQEKVAIMTTPGYLVTMLKVFRNPFEIKRTIQAYK